jgi:hypothetical protein
LKVAPTPLNQTLSFTTLSFPTNKMIVNDRIAVLLLTLGFMTLCALVHLCKSSGGEGASHSFNFKCDCVQCADGMSEFHEGLFQIYYGLGHPVRGFCCTKEWQQNRKDSDSDIDEIRRYIQNATKSLEHFWACEECCAEVIANLRSKQQWPPVANQVIESLRATTVIDYPQGKGIWKVEHQFDGPFACIQIIEGGEFYGFSEIQRIPEFFNRMDDLIACERSLWNEVTKARFLVKYSEAQKLVGDENSKKHIKLADEEIRDMIENAFAKLDTADDQKAAELKSVLTELGAWR